MTSALDAAFEMMDAGQSARQKAQSDPGPGLGQTAPAEVPQAPAPAKMPSQPAQTAELASPPPSLPSPPGAMDQALQYMPQAPANTDDPAHMGTPDDPIDISPLGVADRFKMSFGNAKGRDAYLRKNFEDVMTTKDNGLLVKKGGKWHEVDPGTMWNLGTGGGNFGDKVYEFAKDVADLSADAVSGIGMAVGAKVGSVMGGVAGGIAGTAVAGGNPFAAPLGEVGGAIAGAMGGEIVGGALASKVRTSLGRIVNTYEATPEEELRDNGVDALYAIGGQAVAAGVRPVASGIVSSAKWVGDHVPPAIKDMFAVYLGKSTGAGTEAVHTLWNAPGRVVQGIKSYVARAAGDTAAAVQMATDDAIGNMKSFLAEATHALPNKWAQGVKALIENPRTGTRLEADMPQVFLGAGSALEEAGFGRIVAKEAPASEATSNTVRRYYDKEGALKNIIETERTTGKELTADGAKTSTNEMTQRYGVGYAEKGAATMHGEAVNSAKKFEGGFEFVPFTGEEIAQRAGLGKAVESLDEATVKEVNSIVRQLGVLANSAGTVRGEAAGNTLIQYNKLINALNRAARKKGDEQFQGVVDKISSGFREQVGQQFEKAGLASEYTALAQTYQKFEDQVGEAYRLMNLPAGNGPELALKRISTEAGQNARTKAAIRGTTREPGLIDLVPEGADKLQRIAELDATRHFIPRLTPVWGVGSLASGAVAKGLGIPLAASHPVLTTAAVAGGFMPRAVAYGSEQVIDKALPAVRMGTDFLKNLTPRQLREFMTNETAVRSFLVPIVGSVGREEQITKDLLQQSGTLPNE